MKKLTYKDVGDNYEQKDPLKVFALNRAISTQHNFHDLHMKEVSSSRGEGAYVFDMGQQYGAFTQEGLGTKNLIADALLHDASKQTYYDAIGIDTVATIVNDLITVGARPVIVSPHWALGSNEWMNNKQRFEDLVDGWVEGCNVSGAVYGGGETPTLKGIVNPNTIELSGAAFGVINPKSRLVSEEKLTEGDVIILFESSGIHTNGLSLARSISEKQPNGYKTILKNGETIGEALLTPSIIYSKLVQQLFESKIDIHYLVHMTGHGWRKLMRATKTFTYHLHRIPPVQEEFTFLADQGNLSTEEMYGTFNMGAGFACFVAESEAKLVMNVAKKCKIKCWNAGVVKKGERQVIIEPLGLTFSGESLQLK